MRRLFLSYSFGEFIAKGLNLLLVLVLPFALDQGEYGRLGLLLASEAVLMVCIGGGGGSAFLRLYSRLQRFPERFFTSAFFGWARYSLPALVLAVVCCAALSLFDASIRFALPVQILFLCYIFLAAARENVYSLLRVEQRIGRYTLVKIGSQVAKVGLVGAFALLFETADAYVWGSFISALSSFVLLADFIRSRVRIAQRGSRKLGRLVVSFGLPLMLGSIATSIMGLTDRYMLDRFVGAEEVGVYTFASTVAGANFFLLSMLSFTMIPGFFAFKSFEPEGEQYLRKMTYLGLVLTVGSSIGLFLAFQIAIVRYLPEYARGNAAFLLLQVKFCLSPLYLHGYYMLLFFNASERVPLVTFLVCALNGVLNYVLIPTYGIWGAALATLLSDVALVVTVNCLAVTIRRKAARLPALTKSLSTNNSALKTAISANLGKTGE
ncbi:MAG: oligosaccharide flippase family protein [Bdellovibrionales bacterium]|nr:oligosaccharide flippase family protein [Bdellovibrionales bacterium]